MRARLLFGVMLLAISVHFTPAFGTDHLYCSGFESCSTADAETIAALEARVAELERLLAGSERSVSATTGEDMLSLSSALQVAGLPSTEAVGNSPVCFDLEGNVLPCPDYYVVPPEDSLIGRWTGMKTTSPDYSGTDLCFDDEVSFDIALVGDYLRPNGITTRRINVGIDVYWSSDRLNSGFLSGSYAAFDTSILYTMQFDSFGIARGEWTESSGSCYGTYELIKE